MAGVKRESTISGAAAAENHQALGREREAGLAALDTSAERVLPSRRPAPSQQVQALELLGASAAT
jgi:hypothetical protein